MVYIKIYIFQSYQNLKRTILRYQRDKCDKIIYKKKKKTNENIWFLLRVCVYQRPGLRNCSENDI